MISAADTPWMQLLPPEVMAVISRSALEARHRKRGMMSGRHTSRTKGFSAIFAEHRPYTPGDNVRDLDWKVYGRTDRYSIKQYVEETNLRATLIVDGSGSMKYRGSRAAVTAGRPCSKFDYALHLAAAFAWLMIRHQDAAGLIAFDDRIRTHIRASGRPDQVRVLLEALHEAEPGGEGRLAEVLHEAASVLPRHGMVMLFSDGFDDADALVQALHHFRYQGHETVFFHILAEEELTFPFRDMREFRDLEGVTPPLRADAGAIRSAYLERVRDHSDAIRLACGRLRVAYVPLSTATPCETVLSDFLNDRQILA